MKPQLFIYILIARLPLYRTIYKLYRLGSNRRVYDGAHLHELDLTIAQSCRIWVTGAIVGFVERRLLYLVVY